MYSGLPFPDIDPVLFQVGFFAVRWYSLAYIFGLVFAWLLARQMSVFSKSTFTVLKIDDFLFWATIGVIAGGRLGFCLFYQPSYFLEYPWKIFYLWEGGMSFHGGLIGVTLATILFAKSKKLKLFMVSDIITVVAPIGLFFGRLANFINGELYGRVTTSVPWAIIFPMGGDEPRHPSQLYEAFVEGFLLFVLLNLIWWKSVWVRKHYGFCTGLFFALYGAGRMFLEQYREPDDYLGFVWQNATMGQILCLPMIVFGISVVIWSIFKGRQNEK